MIKSVGSFSVSSEMFRVHFPRTLEWQQESHKEILEQKWLWPPCKHLDRDALSCVSEDVLSAAFLLHPMPTLWPVTQHKMKCHSQQSRVVGVQCHDSWGNERKILVLPLASLWLWYPSGLQPLDLRNKEVKPRHKILSNTYSLGIQDQSISRGDCRQLRELWLCCCSHSSLSQHLTEGFQRVRKNENEWDIHIPYESI